MNGFTKEDIQAEYILKAKGKGYPQREGQT